MRSPIICGVDGSRASCAAARLARTIAKRLARPLELLHVTYLREEAERLARGQALQAELEHHLGPHVPLQVETGHPERRLIDASRRAALLLIGSRGAGAIRRALAGSVTTAVARSAAAPVVVVPPDAVSDVGMSLGCGGVVSALRDERDLAAAATAACWARDLDLELTLAHVLPPQRLPVATGIGPPPAGLAYSPAELAASARAMLDEIASMIAPSAPAVCHTRLLDGPVGRELARLAFIEAAALIAVGPLTHGSLARAFARTPTNHLLRHAPCPVMICPSPEAVLAAGFPAAGETGGADSARAGNDAG
jgi:nucleotide-binding universal stress UspA family protein